MKLEKFLPIGTVVLLKGGKDKLMITGFLAVNLDDNDSSENAYDYSGCPYPEGMLSVDETFLFNHEDIEEIFRLFVHLELEHALHDPVNLRL